MRISCEPKEPRAISERWTRRPTRGGGLRCLAGTSIGQGAWRFGERRLGNHGSPRAGHRLDFPTPSGPSLHSPTLPCHHLSPSLRRAAPISRHQTPPSHRVTLPRCHATSVPRHLAASQRRTPPQVRAPPPHDNAPLLRVPTIGRARPRWVFVCTRRGGKHFSKVIAPLRPWAPLRRTGALLRRWREALRRTGAPLRRWREALRRDWALLHRRGAPLSQRREAQERTCRAPFRRESCRGGSGGVESRLGLPPRRITRAAHPLPHGRGSSEMWHSSPFLCDLRALRVL